MAAGTMAAIGGATLGTVAGTASAATGTTCSTGKAAATITPGVTFSPRSNKISATFSISGCKKAGNPPATAVSGTIHMTSKTLTCNSGSAAGTFTAKANNSKHSAASGTIKLIALTTPLKFNITGKVTRGFLAGSAIKGTFSAVPPLKGNCSQTAPLTKATIKNDTTVHL
jgi:hypothetical protein